MASKAITPEEAGALMQQGAIYVDVRSEVEFEAGHPEGALNVPISHKGPAGMVPNQDFVAVMQAAFAQSEVLILGCKSGPRSNRAAEVLARVGFTNISTMPAGFHGSRDAFGRPLPGWTQCGLPVGQGAPAGQTYQDVKERKPGG